ncbi:MAG: methyltransferase [Candidatus Omnitrophica bacterium]|nr:methyltransferase [Candidatus Omnitrophota bacterium]
MKKRNLLPATIAFVSVLLAAIPCANASAPKLATIATFGDAEIEAFWIKRYRIDPTRLQRIAELSEASPRLFNTLIGRSNPGAAWLSLMLKEAAEEAGATGVPSEEVLRWMESQPGQQGWSLLADAKSVLAPSGRRKSLESLLGSEGSAQLLGWVNQTLAGPMPEGFHDPFRAYLGSDVVNEVRAINTVMRELGYPLSDWILEEWRELQRLGEQVALAIPNIENLDEEQRMQYPEYVRLKRMRNFLELYVNDLYQLEWIIRHTQEKEAEYWPAVWATLEVRAGVSRTQIQASESVIRDLLVNLPLEGSLRKPFIGEREQKILLRLSQEWGVPLGRLAALIEEEQHRGEKQKGLELLQSGRASVDYQIAMMHAFQENLAEILHAPIQAGEVIVHKIPSGESVTQLFATHATQPEYLASMALMGIMGEAPARKIAPSSVQALSGGAVTTGTSFQVGAVERTFGNIPNPYGFYDPQHNSMAKHGYQYFLMTNPRPGGEYGVFIPWQQMCEARRDRDLDIQLYQEWSVGGETFRRKIAELGRVGAEEWRDQMMTQLTIYNSDVQQRMRARGVRDLERAVQAWREEGTIATGRDPWMIEHRAAGEEQGEITIYPPVDGLDIDAQGGMLMVPAAQLEAFLLDIMQFAAEHGLPLNPDKVLPRVVPYEEENLQLAMLAMEHRDLNEVRASARDRVWRAWDALTGVRPRLELLSPETGREALELFGVVCCKVMAEKYGESLGQAAATIAGDPVTFAIIISNEDILSAFVEAVKKRFGAEISTEEVSKAFKKLWFHREVPTNPLLIAAEGDRVALSGFSAEEASRLLQAAVLASKGGILSEGKNSVVAASGGASITFYSSGTAIVGWRSEAKQWMAGQQRAWVREALTTAYAYDLFEEPHWDPFLRQYLHFLPLNLSEEVVERLLASENTNKEEVFTAPEERAIAEAAIRGIAGCPSEDLDWQSDPDGYEVAEISQQPDVLGRIFGSERIQRAWTVRYEGLPLLLAAQVDDRALYTRLSESRQADRTLLRYFRTDPSARMWAVHPYGVSHIGPGSGAVDQLRIPVLPGVWPGGYASLLLEAALPLIQEGDEVVDLGCGTGIIGIRAAEQGAFVQALDLDLMAVENTRVAAEISGVADRVVAKVSDGLAEVQEPVDFILFGAPLVQPEAAEDDARHTATRDGGFNLMRSVMQDLPRKLKPGGSLIMYNNDFVTEKILRGFLGGHSGDFQMRSRKSESGLVVWVVEYRPVLLPLGPEGLPDALHLNIPGTGYNSMAIPEVAEIFRSYLDDLADPEGALAFQLKRNLAGSMAGWPTFENHSAFLRQIGGEVGMGSTVYYPFGGADPYTPFAMDSDVEDVIAFGLENFGSPGDIQKMFGDGNYYHRVGGLFGGIDSHLSLVNMLQRLGLNGIGPLALARCVNFLGAGIEGVYYFDLQEDGDFRFLTEEDMRDRPEQGFRNAVIQFEDPHTGRLKRFWYMQDNVYDQTSPFRATLGRLRFDTLLLKGALDFLEPGTDPSDVVDEKVLQQARRLNANVVADMNQQHMSRGIWRVRPDSIPIPLGEMFGYGGVQQGGEVHYGPSTMLVEGPSRADEARQLHLGTWPSQQAIVAIESSL